MELLGKSLTQLVELIAKKELRAVEINEYFKKRIKAYDSQLHSFLTVSQESKDTLQIAVKDNFCTKGMTTTASSKVLENFVPPYDATVIKKIKEDGFEVLGKTNMDAWAHGSSTETSDFGPTYNPWDTERTPGGSSGGSAAAMAAYLTPAALGTETAGSIRQPASWCGVVGLKPTYGRVSRYGIVAMGSSLDCPGPITSCIEDSAYLLEKIAGHDAYDATTSTLKPSDYKGGLSKTQKFKIGISDEYFEGVSDKVKDSVLKSIDIFKKMGHEVKKIKLLSPKYAISVYTIIQRSEVSSNLARYDGVRYGNGRSAFGTEAKKRIMLGTYTLSHGYYDAFYKKALKVRELIIEDFKNIFNDVDMIVSPTTPITALKLKEFEKYPFFGEVMDVLNEPAAVAGIPALSIPCGLDDNNLPIGMQIMGRYFDEASILNLAYQFEKETDYFGVIKKGRERYAEL